MGQVIRLDRVRPALVGVAGSLALLAGCAVHLGPSYKLRRETLTVRNGPGSATLHIHVDAVLRNNGNRALDSLEIRLPRLPQSGLPEPVQVAGHTERANAVNRRDASRLRVPLNPPLAQKRSLHVSFGYSVPIPTNTYFLEPHEWFPFFLPPSGLFGQGERRAGKTRIHIYVPGKDLALTAGRLRRVRRGRSGRPTEYVYEVRNPNSRPFLLAGPYVRQNVRAEKRTVLFWTRAPLEAGCARNAADQVAGTANLYRSLFGRLQKRSFPIRVVEFPSAGRVSASGSNVRVMSIPDGLLFSTNPSEICGQGTRLSYLFDRALAATWFGWALRPEPGDRAILGNGLRDYAALIAEQTREDPNARNRQVRDWLAEFDRLSSRTEPLLPGELGLHPTGDQRRMASVQSAMFFVALEDRCGAEPVHQALRDVLGSLSGGTVDRNDLRSALERECGTNLYHFFNQWIGHAGIPKAFRERYQAGDLKSDSRRGPGMRPRRKE